MPAIKGSKDLATPKTPVNSPSTTHAKKSN
jgi:hypothetical protein